MAVLVAHLTCGRVDAATRFWTGDGTLNLTKTGVGGASRLVVGAISGTGTLSPGNSIATLATGTATFAEGATFAYESDSTNPLSLGVAADLLVVDGNLDTGNGTILTVTDLAASSGAFLPNTTFTLIDDIRGVEWRLVHLRR